MNDTQIHVTHVTVRATVRAKGKARVRKGLYTVSEAVHLITFVVNGILLKVLYLFWLSVITFIFIGIVVTIIINNLNYV